jgi:TonB-dependent starch-binding outer membrane protein SusC
MKLNNLTLASKLWQSLSKTLMLLLICFLVPGTSLLFAQDVQKISLKIKEASYAEIFKAIEKKTNYLFFYNDEISNENQKFSIDKSDVTIEQLLEEVLKDSELTYKIIEENIVITKKSDKKGKGTLKGKITDSENQNSLIGATISLKGTKERTITDFDGNFSMVLDEPESSILEITSIGYQKKLISVRGALSLNISLDPATENLNEVIVVGYGLQKKRDVIGSVATINVNELKTRSATSFDAGLQGLAAGVSVQSQSGAPGAPSIIKIRGTNSINSSTDPLWIIDGIPVYSNPWGLGASNVNPMASVNPNDIESVQVLKDAAATSIYGSRASNGIIIVTTKGGKKGVGSTSFNFSSGISSLSRTPEDVGYVNTNEWFKVMDAAYTTSFKRPFRMNDYYRFAPQAYTKLTREQAEAINTNWYDELFQNASFQEYNLSSTNGYEKGSFYLSGNYRKDKGVQVNNNMERFSVRSNVTFNPNKNLTFSAKINFSASNVEKRNSGVTSIVTYALPWFPVMNPENEKQYFNAYTGSNPVALTDPENRKNNVEQLRGMGVLSANYNVEQVKGLSFRTELSADIIQSNLIDWESRDIWLNGAQKPTARANEEAVTYKGFNFNIYGTYTKTTGDHSYTAVVGTELTRSSQYSRILRGEGLIGKYQELGTPNVMTQMYGGLNGERYLMGYFGRADYKYKDKYIFGLSARQDGTSAFTEDYRWGTFFAASAGWIITEEDFASFLGEDNFVKIRGSYGETGNQNVPSGLDVINYSGISPYGSKEIMGVNGTVPVNLMVADLTWESTKSADFGFDFGFFKNKLNGSLAYYHRLVYGMLLPAPVPVSAGVGSQDLAYDRSVYDLTTNRIWSNVGNMVNTGLELELHSVNIDKNGFKWTTDFNISFNKNIIKSLTQEADQSGKGIVSTTTVSRTGQRRNEWFIADYAGVDRMSGIPMIYALDKKKYDETGETERLKDIAGKDSLILATRTNINGNRFYQKGKSADPKYYGGITNTFYYKGFDFGFMFSFSGGNYILDYDRQLAAVPNETRIVLSELYDNSWKKPGDVTKYPQMVARGTYMVNGVPNSDFGDSDVFHNRELYKGNYLRLRNIQIGYSLSAAQLKKWQMQSLRIYTTASNLFTATKYPGFDPEGAGLVYYSSAIPQLKSIMFGIDVKF